MKALKIVMVVLIAVAFILPAVVVNQAHAAETWADCWVHYAGSSAGIKIVMLTDVTYTTPIFGTWFQLSATDGNALLSTALTAIASGMKVKVWVTDVTPGSTVKSMLILDR